MEIIINLTIEAVRAFVIDLRERMDDLNATLESGESVELYPVIAFEVPASVSAGYKSALDSLARVLS